MINERKIDREGYVIPVKKAQYGKQAQLIGAAALVAKRYFDGEKQFFA